jgi:hypothetical protein
VCKNFNLFGNCSKGDACERIHECALCGPGQKHPLKSRHSEMASRLRDEHYARAREPRHAQGSTGGLAPKLG